MFGRLIKHVQCQKGALRLLQNQIEELRNAGLGIRGNMGNGCTKFEAKLESTEGQIYIVLQEDLEKFECNIIMEIEGRKLQADLILEGANRELRVRRMGKYFEYLPKIIR